jgi:hypothetical protein
MRTEVIPLIALSAVEAGILALLPILLIAAGTRVINGLRDARLPWTPYIELAAFATGVAAGVIVFGRSIDPALLGPSEVFRAGGTWDLSFGEFLARLANPLHYDLAAIFLSQSGALILLLGVIIIAAPIVRFQSPAAISNGIRNAFLAVSGAYLTIYGFGYCLWLLNRLNFWIFLLLMIIIHLRSRSDHVVVKLN